MTAARTPRARPRQILQWLSLVAAAGVLVLGAVIAGNSGLLADRLLRRAATDPRIPVAVLGDSDSHGYRDTLWFPPGGGHRGGPHRDITLQWTEVLATLRADAVDLGDCGVFGGRKGLVQALEWLGLERRAPRKLDHQYNLAFSGAHCHDLLEGPFRQVPRLLWLMDQEPERWRRGVVVVRIGIVDLGGESQLEAMARDPLAADLVRRIDGCTAAIAAAVAAVHARHPGTRIVLVGLFDNSDIPQWHDRWRSPRETTNIRVALDRFDGALRRLAAPDPRIAFVDDRAWFHARWGSRDQAGAPDYRAVVVAEGIRVEHAVGDEPGNTALADGHAGLVCNTLWCQSLTRVFAEQLALPVAPITDGEVEKFLRNAYPAWR